MATPTLTSITPDSGHPGGNYLVTIEGTNFEPHPSPAATGPTAKSLVRSVEVEIDGQAAGDVRVYSSTKLTCLVPKFLGDHTALSADPGYTADVVIRNIGPPIEQDTFVDAFAYQRADLTRNDGVLRHVIGELVLMMRREIISNIALSTHVDYDSTTSDNLDIVELAGIPGISLFGPDITEDVDRRHVAQRTVIDTATGEFVKYRRPRFCKVAFEATLHGQTSGEAIALATEFTNFFSNNVNLVIDADPGDPSAGTVSIPMFLTSDTSRSGTSNESSTFDMIATFELHGVEIDADDRVPVRWGRRLGDPADVNAQVGDELT